MGIPSVVFSRVVDITVASMGHNGSERGTLRSTVLDLFKPVLAVDMTSWQIPRDIVLTNQILDIYMSV
jgi:hypothetical protein